MRLVKKTFILALCLGLSGSAIAGIGQVSTTQSSEDIHDSSVFPAKSSATSATGAINPFDNSGIVYGIWLSTPASGNPIPYVTLRDSNTANTESAVLVQVFFATATVVANSQAPGYFAKFDPPLRIVNGLSANASTSGCPTQGPSTWCYTVVYDSNP